MVQEHELDADSLLARMIGKETSMNAQTTDPVFAIAGLPAACQSSRSPPPTARGPRSTSTERTSCRGSRPVGGSASS
jgi:hypothetical protein